MFHREGKAHLMHYSVLDLRLGFSGLEMQRSSLYFEKFCTYYEAWCLYQSHLNDERIIVFENSRHSCIDEQFSSGTETSEIRKRASLQLLHDYCIWITATKNWF